MRKKMLSMASSLMLQVALVVKALKPATVTLCLDTNGNHVVQRLLQHLAPTDNEFVFEVMWGRGDWGGVKHIVL